MMDFGPHHMLSSGLNDFFCLAFSFFINSTSTYVLRPCLFIFFYIYTLPHNHHLLLSLLLFRCSIGFFYRSFMNERRINADSSRVLSVSVLTTRGCEFKAYLSQGGYKQDDNWSKLVK